MHPRRPLLGLAALGALALALPGTAAEPVCYTAVAATATSPAVQACRQDAWIHQGTQKAGNLAGQGQSTVPSWNGTKPTAQLESGAGGGYATMRLLDIATPGDSTYVPTFAGEYTGVLDRFAVDLYAVVPVNQALASGLSMQTTLTVDGTEVFTTGGVLEQAVDVPIEATEAGGGRIGVLHFAFDNLAEALESNGLANAAGTRHTIRFTASPTYWGDEHTVFLYDEADVPSGIVVNPANLSAWTRIDAAPPVEE